MQVTFAHGLLGDKSFPYRPETFTQGTFNAVREAAVAGEASILFPSYQRDDHKYPTLTEMGQNFASKLFYIGSEGDSTDDELYVGSSVGAIVMLQTMLNKGIARDMILYKPIYDMVWAAGMLMGADNKQAVLNGSLPGFDIPVASTEIGGDQGIFRLTREHLLDPEALRFIEQPEESVQRLRDALAIAFNGVTQIQNMQIVCAEGDRLSPPALAHKFAAIIQPLVANPVEIVVLDGSHGTDHSAWLKRNVKAKLAAGWGRRPA